MYFLTEAWMVISSELVASPSVQGPAQQGSPERTVDRSSVEEMRCNAGISANTADLTEFKRHSTQVFGVIAEKKD